VTHPPRLTLRLDQLLVPVALGTAVLLGAVAGNLGQALWGAVALCALSAAMVAFWLPRGSLCAAAILPLVTYGLPSVFMLPVSTALATGAIASGWGTTGSPGRRAAALALCLGGVTLCFGVALAPTEAGRGGMIAAVVHATLIGAGAAIVGLTERHVAAVAGAAGVACAWALLKTPEITVDRTIAVLGQNANGLGFLCALGLVALMALLRIRARWWTMPLLGLGVVEALGIVASGSRGAVVAAGAGVIVLLLPRWARSSAPRAVLTLSVAGGLVAVLNRPALAWFLDLTGRAAAGAAGNVEARESSLRFALERGMEDPLTGVGLGNLASASLSSAESRLGQRAHNVFAGIFAEAGIFALVALASLCAVALYQSRRHSPHVGLPLAVTVCVGGLSLEWWGSSGTGPLAVLVLAWAAAGCAGVARTPGSTAQGPVSRDSDRTVRRSATSARRSARL